MMRFSRWFLLFVMLAAGRSFAARPLETDDAGTVDPGSFEIELGAAFESDPSTEAWETGFGIKSGIVPGVDLGLGFGWQWLDDAGVTESGVTDLEIGAKWNFLSETNRLPSMSVTAAVKLPTADEDKGLGSGETDWDLTVVLSKALSGRLTGHLNAGYGFIKSPATADLGDVLHGSAALEFKLSEAFCITGEVLAEREREDGAKTELMGNLGMRWVVSDALAFDTACGTSLNGGDAPDFYATVGRTWRID